MPIAALVLLGLISVRQDWFDGEGVPHLARFVTHFGLPAAVFLVIATQDLSTLLNVGFFKAYGLGTVAAGLLLISFLLALGRGTTHAGISWIGGTSCNCMMIGIAIAPVLLGGNAVAVMGMVSFFQDVFILPFALMLAEMERGGDWRASFVTALVRNLKSPLIIGIALGFVVAALPFDLPAPAIHQS